MLNFVNDYSEGACKEIIQRLTKTNSECLDPYGNDKYSISAKEKIKKACECECADVYFLFGGTQTNQVVIDSVLAPYEGVIAAATGHIAGHEAGAIEYSGHKVIPISQTDGKLSAEDVRAYMQTFYADENHEHMVFPGMVYISQPTEYGTLYSKQELEDLASICREYKIPLYADGARLGYALASGDATLPDMAKYCDIFYIGGTKVGALCGEAVVFTKNNTPAHFMTQIKQHGALSAKGRLAGIQFDTLFSDGLYLKISQNAIKTANMLKKIFEDKGYRFYLKTPTNQIFIILENNQLKKLKEKVEFAFWEKYDDCHTVVRFATSFATTVEKVNALAELL